MEGDNLLPQRWIIPEYIITPRRYEQLKQSKGITKYRNGGFWLVAGGFFFSFFKLF